MAQIGLIDVDGHNFPNLALMKLSAYHKSLGDHVEWWMGLQRYDVVYQAKVFTDEYTEDERHCINAGEVIRGGTGYDAGLKLPDCIETCMPDYSLYGIKDTAYGYLSRGCPRGCPFCIVGQKEGYISQQVADLDYFCLDGHRHIKLLDPNLLACTDAEKLLRQLISSKKTADITQGLDIRLVNSDTIDLILSLKAERLHFAWDNPKEDLIPQFTFFRQRCQKHHSKLMVYVLTNYNSTHDEDLWRIDTLKRLGYNPYVMIYDKPNAPELTRRLQGWVNNKKIFGKVKQFKDFNRDARRGVF